MSMDLNDPGAVGPLPGYLFPQGGESGSASAFGAPSEETIAYLQAVVNATAEQNLPLREAVDVLYLDEVSLDEEEIAGSPGSAGLAEAADAAGQAAKSKGGTPIAKQIRLNPAAIGAIRRGRGGRHVQPIAERVRDLACDEAGEVLKAVRDQAEASGEGIRPMPLPSDAPLKAAICAAGDLRNCGYGGELELILVGGLERFASTIGPQADLNYLRLLSMVFPKGVRTVPVVAGVTALEVELLKCFGGTGFKREILGVVFDPSARGIRLEVGANFRVAWNAVEHGASQILQKFSVVSSVRAVVTDRASVRLLYAPKASPGDDWGVGLIAEPAKIKAGEKVRLTWASVEAETFGSSDFGAKTLSGSIELKPTATRDCTITVKRGSDTKTATARVTVT